MRDAGGYGFLSLKIHRRDFITVLKSSCELHPIKYSIFGEEIKMGEVNNVAEKLINPLHAKNCLLYLYFPHTQTSILSTWVWKKILVIIVFFILCML